MGMLGLIGGDKPDCEWGLMRSRPTGRLGVLSTVVSLL